MHRGKSVNAVVYQWIPSAVRLIASSASVVAATTTQ